MKRFASPRQGQRFLFAFGSIREHFWPRRHLISAPEWRTEMTNRFAVWNQIINRRSGLKDAVSHYLSPPNPPTSTAPQPFPNNLTMPSNVYVLRAF